MEFLREHSRDAIDEVGQDGGSEPDVCRRMQWVCRLTSQPSCFRLKLYRNSAHWSRGIATPDISPPFQFFAAGLGRVAVCQDQVLLKPFLCERGHPLQRTRLLKQVSGAGDNFHTMHRLQFRRSLFI